MKEIDERTLDRFIQEALFEDVRDGDHTSLACIPANSRKRAKLLVKDEGVIAGVKVAEKIFKMLDADCLFTKYIDDGQDVKYGDIVFEVEANAQSLLKGERLVLNTMQRMSGISTMSSRFAVEVEGLPVQVLDTRKTTPRLRFLEKWAVRIGGCHNYRAGLYDWIMIKDNHVDACGSHTKAIEKVHQYLKEKNLNLGITVEVRNLVELHEVLKVGGITRIMLDNFELPLLAEAVATINGQYESEASGGVTLKTVRKIAKTGVNYISVGALTHSAGCLDLSLKIQK
ncbi:MAG TPA: carboxylating nicotinate-nucleotide diphosphorylase [Saprospiraceae bacterium]|nr:carboxylating nicotinate-nucleotide diphosphorylase [Saprospiraceae bacterium]